MAASSLNLPHSPFLGTFSRDNYHHSFSYKPLKGKLVVSSNRNASATLEESIDYKKKVESPVKIKKRVPLRPFKISAPLPVPDHIARPSYVGSTHLPELSTTLQIHDSEGISGMKAACQLAAKVLDFAGTLVKPSITTNEIDKAVHNMIIESGAYPSMLGFSSYPKSISTSVNECVSHGIPDSRQLQRGDTVTIDVAVYLNGYHGSTSRTFMCGEVHPLVERFLKSSEICLERGMSSCKDGTLLKRIGKKTSECAEKYGYKIVERFVGHGIGSNFHSEPLILHHINDKPGRMVEGQTFTIGPILTMKSNECVTWDNGWTCVTADGWRAVKFEHTVLITTRGYEILTQL